MCAATLRPKARALRALAIFACSTAIVRTAAAEVVAAEPLAPITAPYPDAGDGREVQVVLQLIVDVLGHVESVVETSRAPSDAPDVFSAAAMEAAKRATFRPSSRDGKPIRSRVEYVVVFRSPPRGNRAPDIEPIEEPGAAASPAELPPVGVTVRAPRQPRGLGEFQVDRELLDVSPHVVASEQLSAAPGFFVDHEDSEGVANDVHLRGFDVEHGSGIEFRVGSIPVNSPVHIAGAGYADLNFIIPEVVRSIGVFEGPFDVRQGDAAIAGSASFDLGVTERGYRLKGTYGSFHQRRVAAIVAPEKEDEQTFAAFTWRDTDGFGPGNRASTSGSAMAGYALDLSGGYHMKLSAAAYAARTALPGVIRTDDYNAGRIGFDDSYAGANGQSALATRAHVGAEIERLGDEGARTAFSAWAAVTSLRLRQNFTGALEPLPSNPSTPGPGDLFENTNDDTAIGASALFHTKTYEPTPFAKIGVEPGFYLRAGFVDEGQSLLDPMTLAGWDRRVDAHVDTLDAGGYVDFELHLFRQLRLAGGLRGDGLLAKVDDHLAASAPSRRSAFGFVASPRVSAELEVAPWFAPVISYGEGFRSLEPLHLRDGDDHPYSKVRSIEAGFRSKLDGERYRLCVALFESWVGNELVFDADGGGLETVGASVRKGLVAAVLGKPAPWLDGAASLSLNRAEFEDPDPGESRLVPEVPTVLFRADVGLHSKVAEVSGRALEGRVGIGSTYLAGRHLTDDLVMRPVFVLNGNVGVRYAWASIDVDGYNLLARRYADDEAVFASTWSTTNVPRAPTVARHFTAAAPLTILVTLSLYLGS